MTSMENKFGVSGKTIGKIIKSTTGKTFQEYVEGCRIELAKRLITQPDSNMKVVVQECGFINYFTNSLRSTQGFRQSNGRIISTGVCRLYFFVKM